MKDYNYATQAEYYDIVEGNTNVKDFNNILNKLLKKYNIKSVLDITCGTGAQAIFLDKEGYKVTASDFSKEMIAIAQKKYPKLDFKQGDIRNAKYGKFDAVISIFNAIGHLSKPDFGKAIRNITNNLKTGGIYIFDIFNLDFMKHGFIKEEFIDTLKEVDGTKFVRFNKNTFDSEGGVIHMNQKTYIQKGLSKPKIFKDSWDMQIYSSDELKDILEKNGFEVLEFLDMNGDKFDKNKSLFILTIARKK
ncbi:MAG: class I SAM-dependent methyltransferase [Candidatus Nanoarchaeia archaeon]|nr:class I SAM-dependent methyltransferase [Candidatus Nanoarchaeia archaeon]MDD5741509.1 class I SAM-dependent methyltransferase [Candidatus Nanoarchaeia archaeon]